MISRNQPIPIDGLDKPRSLFCSVNALAQIKQATGENPLDWKQEDWQALMMAAVREADPQRFLIVLRAFLAHEDKSITVEQLGEMVCSVQQVKELFVGIAKAYFQFFGAELSAPEPTAEDEDPTKAQTPTSSGQLVGTT